MMPIPGWGMQAHSRFAGEDVSDLEKWDIPLLASPTGADSNRLFGWLREMALLRQVIGTAA